MWRMAMAGVFLVLIQAQEHPAIEVGEDRLLSADGPARPLSESQLSADPNNPKHLLAVVIQFDSPERNTCVAWASFDGGQRWTRRGLPIQCFGDPWSVILSDGSAITVMLGHMDGHDDNAFLLRSPDGGRTWSEPPLGLGDHHDHPMVIAWRKEVYVVSSQGVYESANQRRSSVFVLHSHDGGRTFGQPMRAIPSIPGFAAVGPTLLGNGTLAVGIHNHERQSVGAVLSGLTVGSFAPRTRGSPTSSTECSFNVRMIEASRGPTPYASTIAKKRGRSRQALRSIRTALSA